MLSSASLESLEIKDQLAPAAVKPGKKQVVTPCVAAVKPTRTVRAGEFEPALHFYPKVLNAQIHPLVASFFQLGNERIVARYSHLHPEVDEDKLRQILAYQPKYFAWSGCDLFNVTDSYGHKNMIVIETNSCPSGQKSMPLLQDCDEFGGYGIVLDHAFRGFLEQTDKSVGGLAVLYDKNYMEASGYAAVMAELMQEEVHLVEYYNDSDTAAAPTVKWVDRLLYVKNGDVDEWIPIRACFRYVTQKPWNRFPLFSKTIVLNSILSCLAGGRNKMMAARAYELYNAELESENTGLAIRIPETIRNVSKNEIPLWMESMGGHAVVKVPYSNAGQGVYTITNAQELDDFMQIDHHYDKFIVQSLVGNARWSSSSKSGKFFHVGTIPNKKNSIYVCDLRLMIAGSPSGSGFKPVAMYARKSREPLVKDLDKTEFSSWAMLGTNLSVKLNAENENEKPQWTTDTQRLVLMDRKDFNILGISIDDFIEAYVQTVLSTVAIDRMCQKLMTEVETVREIERAIDCIYNVPAVTSSIISVEVLENFQKDGVDMVRERIHSKDLHFDIALFEALNPDNALLQEVLV